MNLKISAPAGTDINDFLFSLPFNLNGERELANGHLCVTREQIFVYVDNELSASYMIDDFDEYACEQLVGCSMMVGRIDDVDKMRICSFTQDNFIAFAEVCKLINHYLTTGDFIDNSDID